MALLSLLVRKDGSIRITDDQRMLTLEDAGNTKIKWRKVR